MVHIKFRFDDTESWGWCGPPFRFFVAAAAAVVAPFSNNILGKFIQWLIQSRSRPPLVASMLFCLRVFRSLANSYTHFVMTSMMAHCATSCTSHQQDMFAERFFNTLLFWIFPCSTLIQHEYVWAWAQNVSCSLEIFVVGRLWWKKGQKLKEFYHSKQTMTDSETRM